MHGQSGSKTWWTRMPGLGGKPTQVAHSTQAVANWHRDHPIQSLVQRSGLLKLPRTLQGLMEKQATDARFLAGSQGRLEELEQAWARKRVVYQEQLERKGAEIQQAKRYLQVIEHQAEHFRQVWEREDRIYRQERVQREQHRSRDRDRGLGR
jgi:hypothetical protein